MNKIKKRKSFIPALKVVWNILDIKGKLNFIYTILICCLRSLAILSLPQVIACLTAKALDEPTYFYGILLPQSLSFGALLAVNFSTLFILWTFSTYARAHQNRFGGYVKTKYREAALSYILTPRKNMDLKKSTGQILHIVSNGSFSVTFFLSTLLIDVMPYIASAVISLIYIFTINLYFGIGAFIVAMLVIIISIYRNKIDKKCFINMDMIESKINNDINNCINNLPFISFINSAYHELNLLKKEDMKYNKQVKKRAFILIAYWTTLYAIEYAFMFVGLLLMIKSSGMSAIGINTIILLLSYLSNLFSPLNDLGHNINLIVNDAYKASRILEFIPSKDEQFNPGEDRFENKRLKKEKIEKIDIRHLEIEIGDFHKKDITMCFEAGKLSCIVGTSGSGKTTLIGCLLGLKEYKSGDIIINNKYKVKSLYYNSSKVCLTLQNGCIFDRSVMDNIAYPTHTPNALAKRNIKKFGLEKLVARTENGEDEMNLSNEISGGERKRISFVRAASRRGDVYIFDEPTNDLDYENVEKLLEILKKIKERHIVIAISHDKRLMSISDCIYDM